MVQIPGRSPLWRLMTRERPGQSWAVDRAIQGALQDERVRGLFDRYEELRLAIRDNRLVGEVAIFCDSRPVARCERPFVVRKGGQ